MGDSADSALNVPEIPWVVSGIVLLQPRFEPGLL